MLYVICNRVSFHFVSFQRREKKDAAILASNTSPFSAQTLLCHHLNCSQMAFVGLAVVDVVVVGSFFVLCMAWSFMRVLRRYVFFQLPS